MTMHRPLQPAARGWRALFAALIATLVLAAGLAPAGPARAFTKNPAAVFINEIHYDNDSTDQGEAIEIAGPAGTNLSGWTLVLYNGANSQSYSSVNLAGVISDLQNGFGTLAFGYPTDGIQNGPSDGIALVNGTEVVQFLSYEGTITAANGPAIGLTSTDIGRAESDSTPVGHSLQLSGSGTTYQNFAWSAAAANTFNQVNSGQTFAANNGITTNCPAALTTTFGTATSGAVRATDADGTIATIEIISGAPTGVSLSGVTPASGPGGQASATLEVAASTAAGTYDVVVRFTNNDTAPQSASCTVVVTVNALAGPCPPPPNPGERVTPIATVQGSGAASPLAGGSVTITGTVTADFQGGAGLNGFFVQDAGDGNSATSDGIFVFVQSNNPLAGVDVAVGDPVQVSGMVEEFNTLTEITNPTAITRCGDPLALAPVAVDLPVATADGLERYEGMLVAFPETLTVSQNFFQGCYGQVTLSAEGRLYNPTNTIDPNEPDNSAVAAAASLNARRTIVLDDGRSSQNPNPIPYIGPDGTLRAGDTTSGLTGVLDYGLITSDSTTRYYRLHPTAAPTFTRANQRSAEPDPVGGNVRIASFNVLNYFTTIDQSGAQCYPGGTRSDCRGADSALEFERQRTKIITALLAIDADVVGLIEIENNGATAVGDLVGGLNAVAGSGTYTYTLDPTSGPISDTTRLGGDAIRVALIYKPGRVAPIGAAATSADEIFDRPPLAQTFRHLATGQSFTVVVNHFKSKSCGGATGLDQDQGDGQGCYNARRVEQAQALLTLVNQLGAASGDPDVLVIGDLNAYGEEDPIDTLRGGGLIDQVAKRVPAERRYSYIFDGQAGYLDHALASSSMDRQISGVTAWHINADEPSVIDYNTEFKTQDLYEPTPYRSSDHDPVVIGLNLRSLVWLPLVSK